MMMKEKLTSITYRARRFAPAKNLLNKEKEYEYSIAVASERVFNIDGLVMTKQRKNIDPEHRAFLVVSQDFLKRRANKESFKLCPQCPQPPSLSASYKISCAQHNKAKN